jgi:acyl carrier protein
MRTARTIALALAAFIGFANLASADNCRINERVLKIVADEYGKKPVEISLHDKFAADGPNTIEDVEIKLSIEKEFKIKIPDAAWRKLVSVADLGNYVRGRLKSCS